ncbi:MAG: hypothetical protein WC632_01050 [Candidatus Margulisiibacteriota bacterium]
MIDDCKKLTEEINKLNCYKVFYFGSKPLIIYKNHRFIVPIIWQANKLNIIDSNINILCLDKHLDGKHCENANNMKTITTFNDLYRHCRDNLSKNNDDWISILMEESLINRFIYVGEGSFGSNILEQFPGKIFELTMIEGQFDNQGKLNDIARKEELNQLWDALKWEYRPENGFRMDKSTKILLDIDLDYFTFDWRGRHYAWQDQFYDFEFNPKGDKFINDIIDRSPFITIATEEMCCGGKNEAKKILNKLNMKYFNSTIAIEECFAV